MILSEPFIRRPIATSLITFGIILLGIVSYRALGIASLPSVDVPVVQVSAALPGASPQTMAATVATPLEQRFSAIDGVTEMTSSSALGVTIVTLQFSLSRPSVDAARDVQAAVNAASADLPKELPGPPRVQKFNPALFPIISLGLTSSVLPSSAVYDLADRVVAPKLSQLPGVAQVTPRGAEKSAVRIRLDPDKLASLGISLEAARAAVANANAQSPKGVVESADRTYTIEADDQLLTAEQYARIIVATRAGVTIRLADLGDISNGVANERSAGWLGQAPVVLIDIKRQADANIVDTAERVRAALPEIQRWLPPSVKISVLIDRAPNIRDGVRDVQRTMVITALLVMLVIYLFLGQLWGTLIPGLTIPVALGGTFAAMWLFGYSLDNLSLMALTIAIGFVVDDAIVMVEVIQRRIDDGEPPIEAAINGARQISFTIFSITISLLSAFLPIFFSPGFAGRLLREFSVTMAVAIILSGLVSVTLTPALAAIFLKPRGAVTPSLLQRNAERSVDRLTSGYARSLGWALRHRRLMALATLGMVGVTVGLFILVPKGFVPKQDTRVISGTTETSQDISFQAMAQRQLSVAKVIEADPAVARISSTIGGTNSAGVATGYMSIALKPAAERPRETTDQVVDRLRPALAKVEGITTYLRAVQDVGGGGRPSKAQYQYTLRDADGDELLRWLPILYEKLRALPQLVDVATDQQVGGLEARLEIDRDAAGRLGVSAQAIDLALYNAFGQRQATVIHTPTNQYSVILEVGANHRQDLSALDALRVTNANGAAIPLTAVTKRVTRAAPLAVPHQGPFPSATISFNLPPGGALGQATDAIRAVEESLTLPEGLRTSFEGDAKDFRQSEDSNGLILLAAIIGVYIILGVLYESLIHPLTILSSLPSAGVGALLALIITRTELSIVAVIGLVLLIGIVKKNAIMMVDFAVVAERELGMAPREAIIDAALKRFRPITMTTLAAVFGSLPLATGLGAGSELRQPLGIAVVGGLIASQFLTLYTTPVVHLYLARLSAWFQRRRLASHGRTREATP